VSRGVTMTGLLLQLMTTRRAAWALHLRDRMLCGYWRGRVTGTSPRVIDLAFLLFQALPAPMDSKAQEVGHTALLPSLSPPAPAFFSLPYSHSCMHLHALHDNAKRACGMWRHSLPWPTRQPVLGPAGLAGPLS
jgi:hypothetical protein